MKTSGIKFPLKSTGLVVGRVCLLQLYTHIRDPTSSNLLISFKQNNEHRHNHVLQLYVLTAAVKKLCHTVK